jgi:hypothetical protein
MSAALVLKRRYQCVMLPEDSLQLAVFKAKLSLR